MRVNNLFWSRHRNEMRGLDCSEPALLQTAFGIIGAMTTSNIIPQNVSDWIATNPYLLRGATWFAWHRPTSRPNNSGNGYPERTLANPNPEMDYFLRGPAGWEQVLPHHSTTPCH